MEYQTIYRKIGQVVGLGVAVLAICSSFMLGWNAEAIASNDLAGEVQEQVESGLDKVAGAGTTDQIKGRAKEDLGRTQRQIDRVTSQADGAAKQVEGRAQKDLGRTQQAVENTVDDAQDAAEDVVDSVRGFFGR